MRDTDAEEEEDESKEDEEEDEDDEFQPSEGSENEMETEILDYIWQKDLSIFSFYQNVLCSDFFLELNVNKSEIISNGLCKNCFIFVLYRPPEEVVCCFVCLGRCFLLIQNDRNL